MHDHIVEERVCRIGGSASLDGSQYEVAGGQVNDSQNVVVAEFVFPN